MQVTEIAEAHASALDPNHPDRPDTNTPDPNPLDPDRPDTNPTDTDPLAHDLYALVVYLHKTCNADLFAALGELDLSLTQVKLLHQLEEADRELTLKELADLIPVSLPAASRAVDDLVRRGFALRHEDEADRRMKRVRATDAGLAVTARLNAARLSGLEQFVTTLEADHRDVLTRALSSLLGRAEIASCRPTGVTE